MVRTKLILAANWILAMGWHLWRIATLRPAFPFLSDTPKTVSSFIAVYYIVGMLRWQIETQEDPTQTVTRLFWNLVVLILVFERRDRNSSLVCSILGASAVTDLAVMTISIFDIKAMADSIWLEASLSVSCIYQFIKSPANVRARGYQRNTS